jgi:hypothetical protein
MPFLRHRVSPGPIRMPPAPRLHNCVELERKLLNLNRRVNDGIRSEPGDPFLAHLAL